LPTPVKYDSHGTWESNNYHGLGWRAKHDWAEIEALGEVAPRKTYPTPIKADSTVGKNLLTLQKVENKDGAFNMLARQVRRDQMDADGTFFSNPEAKSGVRERQAKVWPTPVKNEDRASKYTLETSRRHFLTGSNQVHLAQAARDPVMQPKPKLWSTPTKTQPKMPRATLLERMNDGKHRSETSVPLVEQLQRMGEIGSPESFKRVRPTKQALDGTWPTPMTTGMRGGSGVPVDLQERLHAAPGRTRPVMAGESAVPLPSEYGELNPEWVEWIMGWCIGWTSLEPLSAEAFYNWLVLTSADPETGRNAWWNEDPSEIPESTITKTIRTVTGSPEEVTRVSRIAALGNGQVSAVVAAAWTMLNKTPELEGGFA